MSRTYRGGGSMDKAKEEVIKKLVAYGYGLGGQVIITRVDKSKDEKLVPKMTRFFS
jgi:hypothetical protein